VSATVLGRVVLAGEWTAGEWHGTMEGALRSGARAARTAIDLLAQSAGGQTFT
jgi:monoamine oxidase